MTDLAVREFVDQFGELPAHLVLDYISEMGNSLAGIPPNGAYIRLAQWLLAVKSGASDEAEYFSAYTITPPDAYSWLQELLEWPEMVSTYGTADALDDMSPGPYLPLLFSSSQLRGVRFRAQTPSLCRDVQGILI